MYSKKSKPQKIEFYKHNLTSVDKKECLRVLNSIFLTTGTNVKKFEQDFAKYLDAKHAIGVSSCTDALFLCLKYLGIQEGDEVITTPMTFMATSNAVLYCNAKPVFVDVEPNTGNMDADLIEKAITPKTKAIIPVHLYGQMCDMKKISMIAKKHNLKIIEDAAHCIEGKRDGIRVGQLSDFACFSFYAIKTITSGEGGMITTNNSDANEWLIKARLHGMSKNAIDRYSGHYQPIDMEFLGYKSNMTNIEASLLQHQLERIDSLHAKREILASIYDKGFENNSKIKVLKNLPNSLHGRFLYTIQVNPQKRDVYIGKIENEGIAIAVHFKPVHLLTYYRKMLGLKEGDFPIAERIGNSTISLPFYPRLTRKEALHIITVVNNITQNS